ncbi:MAG: hypothetical protein JJ873_12930 [Maricaulis sp.]|uniref:hypothetical protein n=1 Tax=Maricaulis sp. TaxID=1486257 RepID=UPI001B2776AC|nr:hypothetical protein [Maricaulis sp.]MBO6878304.1 hypothetical protein [Maricaulis sp.]
MFDPSISMDEDLPPFMGVSTQKLAEEAPDLAAEIETYHPLRSAELVAALQLEPGLLGNNLRIDALAQLCVALGKGRRRPSEKTINRWFQRLDDTHAGLYEDPPEGLFVGLIRCSHGEFMVLEGAWESPIFYLQRFVDIVDGMPDERDFAPIKEAVFNALRISNEICRRARLARYEAGTGSNAEELPKSVLRHLRRRSQALTFTKKQLEEIGVDPDSISVFVGVPETYEGLLREPMGGSSLDRFPFVLGNQGLTCLMPNAISLAIRRFIIESALGSDNEEGLSGSLYYSYAEHFRRLPMLGIRGEPPISVSRCEFGGIGSVACQVDENRFLQFIFVADSFEDYPQGALGGIAPDKSAEMASATGRRIQQCVDTVVKECPDAEGITLVVGCGYGRAQRIAFDQLASPNWRVQHIPAPDLDTLCWLSDFKALDLWRLLDLKDKLAEMDVTLMNVNGLLNIAAWGKALNGHLVPHGDLPDQVGDKGGPLLINVPTDSLRALRIEVATVWDPRAIMRYDGEYARVRHLDKSYFPDPRRNSLYADEDFGTGARLSAVHIGDERHWWISLDGESNRDRNSTFRHWEMLCMWLGRIAPALDELLPNSSAPSIHLEYHFPNAIPMGSTGPKPESSTAPAEDIEIAIDSDKRVVKIVAGEAFEAGLNHPTNIAEEALVSATMIGVLDLANIELSPARQADLLRSIVPSTQARYLHAFTAKEFRHFVSIPYPPSLITIDEQDDALLKLGLGWRKRKPSDGSEIRGASECTSYLNGTIASVEREFCDVVAQFDRKRLCEYALGLHERASFERMRWRATTAALLATHDDKDGVIEGISRKAFELNGVTATTRLILEAALCEAPLSGGRVPSELDFSRLMATIGFVFHMGGTSDAIRWGVMEDRIRVTPLGDIHMNFAGFHEQVVQPYSEDGQALQIAGDAERYHELYEDVAVAPGTGSLDPAFLEAWRAEMGANILAYRAFVDGLEDIGIERGIGVFEMKRSELIAIDAEDRELTAEMSERIVARLATVHRDKWQDTPDGFSPRDRQPWRYRRRLSVLSRPLLQLDKDDDPTFLIAPGLVREAFAALVRNYGEGRFGPDACRERAMKRWVGKAVDRRGAEFTQKVATKLQSLGWECETEVKPTKILGRSLPEDYGDVDVLAWHAHTGRVLLIECKDLQHQKTIGEVAEQLNDFKGQRRDNGKKDNLLKHLDRVRLLDGEHDAIAKYLQLSIKPTINGSLVFKHPVPMRHARDRMAAQIDLWLFDELDSLRPTGTRASVS